MTVPAEIKVLYQNMKSEVNRLNEEGLEHKNLVWRLDRMLYVNERIMRMMQEEEHSLEPEAVALIAERLFTQLRHQLNKATA